MNADDIAKHLNESKPVQITPTGEIVKPEETVETSIGPVNRSTGQPVTELKPQRWYAWYQSNKRRLVDEKEAMQAIFPNFDVHVLPEGLTWFGSLKPQRASRAYTISIVYPDDFPSQAPKVFTVSPKVSAPKHQYGDGSMCLMYPGDGSWRTNTTAVQIVTMAAAWLFCFEYHERHCPTRCNSVPCDYWPGTEARHG